MKNVLNPALFAHRSGNTEGFNNLCTIIHQLRDEGTYVGELQRGKYPIGTFTLRFDKKLPGNEVHIDAAKFDVLFDKESCEQSREGNFEVGGQGYVVFYTSGSHADLRVKLYRRAEKKAELSYDSALLSAGDMVVFRLGTPGAYRVQHMTEKHTMMLVVRAAARGKYPVGLGKFLPMNVRLTPRGFDPSKAEQWPLQALIIQVEIAGALRVEFLEKSASKKARRRRH
jgi:hypothetical protein